MMGQNAYFKKYKFCNNVKIIYHFLKSVVFVNNLASFNTNLYSLGGVLPPPLPFTIYPKVKASDLLRDKSLHGLT